MASAAAARPSCSMRPERISLATPESEVYGVQPVKLMAMYEDTALIQQKTVV